MAFDEIRFPAEVSRGAVMGPGHSTEIIELPESGAEERVGRWNGAKRRYQVGMSVLDEDDVADVLTFALARDGSARGFRWKDWSDFTTAANHRAAPAATDHLIGIGDGVTTTFQMRKAYTSGAITRYRALTRPVAGTTLIAINLVPTAVGWSINTTTGVITFTSPPADGAEIRGGCEFDTPVRFGADADRWLALRLESFENNEIPSIPVVEIPNELPIDDEDWKGGGQTFNPMTANLSLTVLDGRAITVNPNAGGLAIALPDPTNLDAGDRYFVISNESGANAVTLRNHLGATVATIAVSSVVEVVLAVDASLAKTWYAW